MKKAILILICIAFGVRVSYAQKEDYITITTDWGVKEGAFQDYLRFENIDYFKVNFQNEKLANASMILISKEFWNKKLTKTDTIVNLRKYGIKLDTAHFSFRVMSKRMDSDSVKFQFYLPFFHTVRKFKSLKTDIYSLRDIANGKKEKVPFNQKFPLFAYSLPYRDPAEPNMLLYCELTARGVKPEQWGEKYNINHYIVIECIIQKE